MLEEKRVFKCADVVVGQQYLPCSFIAQDAQKKPVRGVFNANSLGIQSVAQRPKRGSDARAKIHQYMMRRVTQKRAKCVGNIHQTCSSGLCICACPVMGKG